MQSLWIFWNLINTYSVGIKTFYTNILIFIYKIFTVQLGLSNQVKSIDVSKVYTVLKSLKMEFDKLNFK